MRLGKEDGVGWMAMVVSSGIRFCESVGLCSSPSFMGHKQNKKFCFAFRTLAALCESNKYNQISPVNQIHYS